MTHISRFLTALALAGAVVATAAGTSFAASNEPVALNRADGSEFAGKAQPVQGSWRYTFASWDDSGRSGALPAVKVINGPAHGVVDLARGSLASDHDITGTALTYVPARGFHGTDSITYQVSLQKDANSLDTITNTYTVQLNVQ